MNSPNDVANIWSVGTASLFGYFVLFVCCLVCCDPFWNFPTKTEIEKYLRETYRSSDEYGRWLL